MFIFFIFNKIINIIVWFYWLPLMFPPIPGTTDPGCDIVVFNWYTYVSSFGISGSESESNDYASSII